MDENFSGNLCSIWNSSTWPRKQSDIFWAPLLKKSFRILEPALHNGSNILEIGCGNGHITNVFHLRGYKATGIDINPDRIMEAKRKYPCVDFIKGSAEYLPFGDESFDVVFSFSVLQYVDQSLVLKEVHRVLKKNGKIIFNENLKHNPFVIAYRTIRKAFGVQFPKYTFPIHHLTWSDIDKFKMYFTRINIDTEHLTSPLAFAFINSRNNSSLKLLLFQNLFTFLFWIDRSILKKLRLFRRYSWMVTISGQRL